MLPVRAELDCPVLQPQEILSFITNGFVRIDRAFSPATAERGRAILWKDLKCDPLDRATWTQPVIRLGGYSDPPFLEAANSPRLLSAFDQLIGPGRWIPLEGLGTFPVRFPSDQDPGDTGWHVDASFPPSSNDEDQTIFSWRINLFSKSRALLMLFLFSDVSHLDAPTRIHVGSHLDVARTLSPAGENGLTCLQLAQTLDAMPPRPQVLATGEAGTVYLCHPFLVHAAQRHCGTQPRFLAQPPLGLKEPFRLNREDGHYSPAEQAIRLALPLP